MLLKKKGKQQPGAERKKGQEMGTEGSQEEKHKWLLKTCEILGTVAGCISKCKFRYLGPPVSPPSPRPAETPELVRLEGRGLHSPRQDIRAMPGSPGALTDPASHFLPCIDWPSIPLPKTYPRDTLARTGHGLCDVALFHVQGAGSPSRAAPTPWVLGQRGQREGSPEPCD